MLETIVHLSVDKLDLPDSYKLLRIGVPLRFPVATLDVPNGASWTKDAAITRQIGNEWLEQNGAALARVPSVIVPYTWNYLLNPRHSDSVRCEVTQVSEHLHDPRLLRIRDL